MGVTEEHSLRRLPGREGSLPRGHGLRDRVALYPPSPGARPRDGRTTRGP